MFRNRARHLVAACAALLLSALLVLPAIGDTEPPASPPKTPPLLFAPPLFASAGQAQDVSAVVTGVPDAVRLVVGDRSFDMHPDGDSLFTGTIPSDARRLRAELQRHRRVRRRREHQRGGAPRRPGRDPLVRAPDPRGRLARRSSTSASGRGRTSSARATPAREPVSSRRRSSTDAAGRAVRILDTVKGRIVDATKDGVRKTTELASGSTTATDVVGGRKGAVLVLDQVRDEVVDVGSGSQRAVGGVGARKHDRGARLAFDGVVRHRVRQRRDAGTLRPAREERTEGDVA